MLFIVAFDANLYGQTVFLETFGTSPIPTASNDYGRRPSPDVTAFAYGTSKANSAAYEVMNIDNGYYAVVAPEFIYSGVVENQFYFWTLPSASSPPISVATKYVEDHTTGDTHGAVLVVNAQTPNTQYYRKNFTFTPDAYYQAEFYIYVVNATSNTKIAIRDPGTNAILGSKDTGDLPVSTGWQRLFINFKAPANTCNNRTATLTLENILQGGNGNDYFIDDIKLTQLSAVPSPLDFTFSCPTTAAQAPVCTAPVLGETFTATNGVSKIFNQPATSNGFVFDIFKLDNSFNMKINGASISTAELEFQAEDTPAPHINIRFVDGTTYGENTSTSTPKIYNMTGKEAAPLIRVEISPTGVVKMFGSKVSGGPLFPLELFNGNAFNAVTWNTTTPNVVEIDQNVVGVTIITGRGYGINIIPCGCFNDANTTGTSLDTKHGITLLKRAGAQSGNWPMVRKGGHTALESNTKGFVVTRLPTSGLTAITNPVDGMMVYDTTEKCLKIYTTSTIPADNGWRCFSTPACP